MPSKALLRAAHALSEARRVPGAAEPVTASLVVAAVLSRRDMIVGHRRCSVVEALQRTRSRIGARCDALERLRGWRAFDRGPESESTARVMILSSSSSAGRRRRDCGCGCPLSQSTVREREDLARGGLEADVVIARPADLPLPGSPRTSRSRSTRDRSPGAPSQLPARALGSSPGR
jgi:hypothetical protein